MKKFGEAGGLENSINTVGISFDIPHNEQDNLVDEDDYDDEMSGDDADKALKMRMTRNTMILRMTKFITCTIITQIRMIIRLMRMNLRRMCWEEEDDDDENLMVLAILRFLAESSFQNWVVPYI